MTEPPIQFARCSDGVSIAYYEIGDGVPLIHTPGSVTNLRTEWQNPGRRRWYERLAASFRVIRYDRRGTGLSDRDVVDYSVEALERDIEAVANQARLQQCAVWGSGYSGPAAMAFTAHHPQRVSRLILYGTDAKGGGVVEARDSTNEYLLEHDWALFSEIWTRQTYEWRDAEQVRAEAARVRESISPEVMRLFLDARRTTDVFETLPQIRCPTLVVYRPQWANRSDIIAPDVELVRATAQAIPGARLVAVECALRCNEATDGSGLQLHLGVHAGDVINEGSNVFGGAVNVAARIAGGVGAGGGAGVGRGASAGADVHRRDVRGSRRDRAEG